MTTQAQLAIALAAISAQLEKASAELVTEIQTLTDAVGNAGGTTPEVDASLARLQAIAQKLDDMNPDVPPAGDTGSGDTAGGDANPGPGTSTGDGSDTSGGTPTP